MLISNDRFLVGADTSVILGILSGFCVFTLIVLLYIKNKRWLWSSFGTVNCCENPCPPVSTRTIPLPSVPTSSQDAQTHTKNIIHTYSVDYGDSSSESEECGGGGGGAGGGVAGGGGGGGAATSRGRADGGRAGEGAARPPAHDLMSLVEKGRIGLGGAGGGGGGGGSSGGSSTASSAAAPPPAPPPAPQADLVSHHRPTGEEHRSSTRELKETSIGRRGADGCSTESSCPERQLDANCNRDFHVMVNMEPEERSECCLMSQESQESQEAAATSTSGGGGGGGGGGQCGHLQVTLLYDAPMRKMTVHVLQARITTAKSPSQYTHSQVRVVLLPSKKQKYKTKIRTGENPQFMESFLFHRINPEDVNSMGIRLRLYGCERIKKEKLIGESIVKFANINLELENNFWLDLERKATTAFNVCGADKMSLSRSDSIGSSHSVQHGGVPELLLGLSYNATTGRLTIEVIKGSHFRDLTVNRPPDTYVKLNLVSSTGQELAHSKTTIRRGQPNPLFKETFVFQVTLFQLADVTLMVSVYNRRGVTKKKEMLGWFSLGLNSSGAEQFAHWMDMKELQQEQICRWHVLVQS